jgi:hypothetical protein
LLSLKRIINEIINKEAKNPASLDKPDILGNKNNVYWLVYVIVANSPQKNFDIEPGPIAAEYAGLI